MAATHPKLLSATAGIAFNEIILFAYADRTTRPTYVCLPQRLVHAKSGRVVERIGPNQEVTSLPGIAFFDAWRIEPNKREEVTYLLRPRPRELTKQKHEKKKQGTHLLVRLRTKLTMAKYGLPSEPTSVYTL